MKTFGISSVVFMKTEPSTTDITFGGLSFGASKEDVMAKYGELEHAETEKTVKFFMDSEKALYVEFSFDNGMVYAIGTGYATRG